MIDTAATFLVIGPATILVLWAVWRYRRAGGRGTYVPGWTHSTSLEAAFWGGPLVVVIFLGFVSLQAAEDTDPAGPAAMAAGRSVGADAAPVDIDVVTTDWQWLFIYAKRNVASANELVIPVHTPIRFRLTSSTVATDFFIPQLAGQIDVMPGMRTWQSLIANRTGDYQGYANDYDGPGFSWMRFTTHVVSQAEFGDWVAKASRSRRQLDHVVFARFAAPTINVDDRTVEYSPVEGGLFDQVIEDTMAGRSYPTPPGMTEKMSHKVNGGQQPVGSRNPP